MRDHWRRSDLDPVCLGSVMLEDGQDGMDSSSLTPGSSRQVCIQRHPSHGFGFIAGSERPVVVRSVFADGPSSGKLFPGDHILAINQELVSDAAREKVIDLVRRCKDSIVLTVLQPQQSPKSAFISAAKKARLRTNPPKVRFSEQVSISDPDSTMLKDDSLLLIPNVLKVFLENGQIKSFTFDSRTTVRDVISSLQDRLSLRYIEHFSLVLESSGMAQNQGLHLLQENQSLSHVVHRTYFQGMKCLFRICFFPKDPADLLRRDPAAFEYLYIQSRNDVIKERFGMDWKSDLTLKLAALHIFITVSIARPNQKISLKHVEKEWGLEPFLPLTLLPTVKEKNVCKTLSQLLKTYQHPPPAGNKVSPLQGKLQYMRVLNDLPPFGGFLFHTVGLDEKQSATTLLVGPRHGISHVIDLKNNLTTVLAEFSRVAKVQLSREHHGVARVEVVILDAKPLVLLMEWPDASNFASLISGYYKLFVDPKKTIYCRIPGQPYMIKADSRSSHAHSRSGATVISGSRREERDGSSREAILKTSAPPVSQHLGLCHIHLKEQQQLQEIQLQAEQELDINENLISQVQSRSRTKSDPTVKSTESVAEQDTPADENSNFRVRAKTMEQSQQAKRVFCDSCKAKLQANGLMSDTGETGKLILQQCTNGCASRRGGAVDLIALPLPGNEEDEEVDEGVGKLQPPPPAIAAPPPGFRDNSSDEDDPKKGRRGIKAASAATAEGQEAVPVTLIDNVATRTVQDHAQELDDALVSTLQALEALAASEDYPHHHQQTPQTAGLIVLAAITPESSLDSGHETNSSELTDVSEMVSAMKQHQNQAYILAHHINKEQLFSRRDFPLTIPGCTTQTIGGGAFSMSQIRGRGAPKSLILSKTVPLKVCPDQGTGNAVELGKSHEESKTEKDAANTEADSVKDSLSESDTPQTYEELKAFKQGSKEEKCPPANEEMLSSNTSEGFQEQLSGEATQETTNIALPVLLPVDRTASANICSTNMCQDAETASSETTKPSRDLLPTADLFCTCPIRPEPGPQVRLRDPQKVVAFHSSSPTDDERLRAKGLQLASNKESTAKTTDASISNTSTLPPTKYSPVTPIKVEQKEKPEAKGENTQSKASVEPQKIAKSLPVLVNPTHVLSCAEKGATIPGAEYKKQVNNKPKSQRSTPFMSFRNLISATFPARLRRETDERRAQLQKVRQYELEFLEELLKPKTSQGEFLPQGSSPVPSFTPCACQLRTSPVQKVPGISREQRRSCDCKRMCRGMRLPDTAVGSAMEQRGRERTTSKTPPVIPKNPHAPEEIRKPQTLEIKTTRIRSTSLESREPRETPTSCTTHSESMALDAEDCRHHVGEWRVRSFGWSEARQWATLVVPTCLVTLVSLEKGYCRERNGYLILHTCNFFIHTSGQFQRYGLQIFVFVVSSTEVLYDTQSQLWKTNKPRGKTSDNVQKREYFGSNLFSKEKKMYSDFSSVQNKFVYTIISSVLIKMLLHTTTRVISSERRTIKAYDIRKHADSRIMKRSCENFEGRTHGGDSLYSEGLSLELVLLCEGLRALRGLASRSRCTVSPPLPPELLLESSAVTDVVRDLQVRVRHMNISVINSSNVNFHPEKLLIELSSFVHFTCASVEFYVKNMRIDRSVTERLFCLFILEPKVFKRVTLFLVSCQSNIFR
ncbi:FERM and PDZ domain-containing protein 3 [Triplophysa tibetana]|uniref:FERM and PDZ domain-containing protein 3 n=1 Tax=Triplophysa tibetana TaxID=1572043 RepID=A0A5A9NGF6_9TELE|nr:FERM and PDZ domain-containing protein 3 [Triplophysa tibetana]